VITATQMLESMINMPVPTRAEVTDVANAIFDGTGAVMLSGETAVGKYPLQVIQTMRRIVTKAEKSKLNHYYRDEFSKKNDTMTFSITHAAIDAACEANVKGILVFTISGETASFLANRRPNVPIYAFTPDETIYRRVNMFWGVVPMKSTVGKDIDKVINKAATDLIKRKFLNKGDRIVVVFGARETTGGTDRLKIMYAGQ
jgi:pyruvate kinase